MFMLYFSAILFFLLLHGFFAGSEAALTTLNRIRLRHLVESENKAAMLVDDFLKKEGLFLGTTLAGTNICAITTSALATALLSGFAGQRAALLSTIIMAPMTLIFGEIIPKTIYRRLSDMISLIIIYPLRFAFWLFYPLIFLLTGIARIILWPFLKKTPYEQKKLFLTKKDLELILRTGRERGGVEPNEEKLFERIFAFGKTTAGNIMIPLYQATMAGINDSIDTLKKISNEKKFTRIPVYENDKNNVVGVINIYDILFSEGAAENASIKDYMTNPYFINDDERIDRLLSNLRKKKRTIAIVINREGKSVGIVTMEDILEEIVGEIEG